MSGLAHLLEREGLATVLIGLVPQHVSAMRPPRALLVPFPFGRPLGEPDDPALQQRVLTECLALLDAPGPPPLVRTFEAPATSRRAETGWVCPVAFPAPASAETREQQILREVSLLMPWFERGRAVRGRSAVGVSGLTVEEAVRWLCKLDEGTPQQPVAGQSLALTFKLAVEDLKTFYLEAATAQPGAGADDVSSWFWQQTVAAELLSDLRRRLKDDESDGAMRMYAAFMVVPEAEVKRRARLAGETESAGG